MTDQSTQTNKLLSCSFCDKSNDKVGYLIVGPEDNRICDLCVDRFCLFIDNPAYMGVEDENVQCSFCTQNKNEVGKIIPASAIAILEVSIGDTDFDEVFESNRDISKLCICDKCIDACCEILQEIQEIN